MSPRHPPVQELRPVAVTCVVCDKLLEVELPSMFVCPSDNSRCCRWEDGAEKPRVSTSKRPSSGARTESAMTTDEALEANPSGGGLPKTLADLGVGADDALPRAARAPGIPETWRQVGAPAWLGYSND